DCRATATAGDVTPAPRHPNAKPVRPDQGDDSAPTAAAEQIPGSEQQSLAQELQPRTAGTAQPGKTAAAGSPSHPDAGVRCDKTGLPHPTGRDVRSAASLPQQWPGNAQKTSLPSTRRH